MRLADWHAHLESAPLTANQLGAIHREATRLGLHDRTERLAVIAALAGLDGLGSTRDLTQGQAGQAVRVLSELPERKTAAVREPVSRPPAVMWADLLAAIARAFGLLGQAPAGKEHRCGCCGYRSADPEEFATATCWPCVTGNLFCPRCAERGVPVDRFSSRRGRLHRLAYALAEGAETLTTVCGLEIEYSDCGQAVSLRDSCRRCWPEEY
jgi:hypothetical protein